MENFKVTWEVKYYDHEPEIVYLAEELIESKSTMRETMKNWIEEYFPLGAQKV